MKLPKGHNYEQLGLPFNPAIIDLDGIEDPKYKGQVRYIGKASLIFDNSYRCLANVGGALCVVEATITRGAEPAGAKVSEQ